VGQVLVGHSCLDSILNEGIKAVHLALIHPNPNRCVSGLNPSRELTLIFANEEFLFPACFD